MCVIICVYNEYHYYLSSMKRVLIILCFIFLSVGASAQSSAADYLLNDSLMRSELVKKDIQQQKAVFATLSPESCYQLWATKFKDNLRSSHLEKGEKVVMRFLYDSISPAVYDSSKTAEKDSYVRIVETAKDVLQQYYDWSPSKLYRYLYTFMTEAEIAVYNASHAEIIP